MPNTIVYPWQKFVLSAQYPTEMIYTGIEGFQDDDIPPLTLALVHWYGLASEVANGGLGQYYFNHAQVGASFVGLDKEIARHPMLGDAASLMKEALERYHQYAEALGITRESGEWPSEFFTRVSSDSEEFEWRILAERDRLEPLLSIHILESPNTYWNLTMNGEPVAKDFTGRLELEPVEDEGWQSAMLVFRNGFPHGPNVLHAHGRETVVSISPDFSQVELKRLDLRKPVPAGEYGACTDEVKNFKLNRKTSRKYNATGTLLEAGNHTLAHKRIGEQWEYFDSGNLMEYQFYSLDGESYALSKTRYYGDGSILMESQRDIENSSLRHMKTFWPNGQLNAVFFGGPSIDDWDFSEAYDDAGNSLLDESRSGELRYANCKRSGEPFEKRADIVDGRFTEEFWK